MSRKFKIAKKQAKINNYPRKLFNGRSSNEMYEIDLKQYIS
ncbi:hypothetical protein [Leptotrichia massiliensis]|nr:hypothetical protein [Leptotrichia massiliensis]